MIPGNNATQGVDGTRRKRLFEIGCARKDLLSRGLETIWGKNMLGRKESQCKVTEVGLSWACSQEREGYPVAG